MKKRQDPSTGLQPIGIVRTIPSLYGDKSIGAKRYRMSIRMMKAGEISTIYIALPGKPRHEVLYMYLVIEGKVDVRMNIAGYEPGDARECWDKTIRKPKIWAVCTGPVMQPKEPVPMRGFQGMRYVYERLF